jgi:hypothetical protein
MYNCAAGPFEFNLALSKKVGWRGVSMLKVIIAIAAVVLSVEVVAISFAPGAEVAATTPVRTLKGDRLDVRPIAPAPVKKNQPTGQAREIRIA